MCDGSCRSGHFCGECGAKSEKLSYQRDGKSFCEYRCWKNASDKEKYWLGRNSQVLFSMCRYCDRWFSKRGYEAKKRFCSSKCWEDAKAKFSKDECKRWKAAMYTFKRSRANYCVQTINSRIEPKACEFCGSVFIPDRTTGSRVSRFCDIECACNWKSVYYRNPESNHQKRHAVQKAKFESEAEQRAESERIKKEHLKKQILSKRWKSCGWCLDTHCNRGPCCSRDCNYKLIITTNSKRQSDEKINAGTHKKHVSECSFCGKIFHQKRATARPQKFCSSKCMKKHTKQNREHRCRTNGPYDDIGLVVLAKKYNMRCKCCGVVCIEATGKNLDNEMTCDHVVPLSKGGTHTWDNVRLLCRRCNTIKLDRVISYENLLSEIQLQVS